MTDRHIDWDGGECGFDKSEAPTSVHHLAFASR
jgi:hypothetical protein